MSNKDITFDTLLEAALTSGASLKKISHWLETLHELKPLAKTVIVQKQVEHWRRKMQVEL